MGLKGMGRNLKFHYFTNTSLHIGLLFWCVCNIHTYLELRRIFSNLIISKSQMNTKNWGIHIDALRLHGIKRIEIFYQNTL